MDGAIGTELQRRGLAPGENAATWNVLHPRRVEAVHRAYIAAGAEVVLTNTFLVNACSFGEALAKTGHTWARESVWRDAYERIPAGPYRLAAVGPVAGRLGQREFADLRRLCVLDRCEPAPSHDGQHVADAILVETCSSPRAFATLARLKRQAQAPLFVSFAYQRDAKGRLVTASGHSPEWFARRANKYGASALGVNCGRDMGMDDIIEIVRRYRQETDLPVFARPNAGTPISKGNRWAYPQTPRALAARLPELLEAGVSMVGGCCGTRPAHIAAFRKVIDEWNGRRSSCRAPVPRIH